MNQELIELIEDCGIEVEDIQHVIERAQAIAVTEYMNKQAEGEVEYYGVLAGSVDGVGFNCKYSSEPHQTLQDAINDCDQHASRPWSYIECNGRYLSLLSADFNPYK